MHPAHPGQFSLYTLEWHFPQQPLDQSSDNSSRKCLRFRCRLSMWYCLRHWDNRIGKHLSSTPSPMIAANNLKKRLLSVLSTTQFAARHIVASDNVSEEAGGSLEIQRKTIWYLFWCTYIYIYIIYHIFEYTCIPIVRRVCDIYIGVTYGVYRCVYIYIQYIMSTLD